jgi:uncharacterized integral membrane protein
MPARDGEGDDMRRSDDFGNGNGDGSDGAGGLPRSGVSPRWIVAGVVAVLLLIFALQNSERVDVDVLFFDAQVRVVTVILVSAVLGFLVGWFVGHPSRAERKAMHED